MKLKRRIGIGLAVAAAIYCVLAYIFMWPPVVRNYGQHHLRTVNPCTLNLLLLQIAIDQWASDNGKHTGDPVTLEQLEPYFRNGKDPIGRLGSIPTCHLGGKYSVTAVGVPPTCSIGTNAYKIRIRRDYFYYEGNERPHVY